MRYFLNIRYGTDRYPEKVARRLRAVNIAAWLFAATGVVFVIKRPWDPDKITFVVTVCSASIPLLHRFGSLAAPLTLLTLYYAQASRIILEVGTGDGIISGFVTAAPLSILVFGLEWAWLAAVLAVIGAGLAAALNVMVPHSTDVLSPQALSINFALNIAVNTAISFLVVLYMARQTTRAEATAEREHERSETLLKNILPPPIAERLKGSAGAEIADAYPEASVLFIDMAGFTSLAGATTPDVLVHFLNNVYTRFDALAEHYGLEKIKTTGDSYMVVGGVPEPLADHAALVADFALDVRDAMIGVVDPLGRAMPVRIGIASGPVVAGVVGKRKFFYDVWGDAVNTASRMESTGEVGKIQVSPATYQLLASRFDFLERGIVKVRGKGTMQTWFLVGRIINADRIG